jgi:hypothetical protein
MRKIKIRNKYIVEEGFLGCSAAWLDDFLPEIIKKVPL